MNTFKKLISIILVIIITFISAFAVCAEDVQPSSPVVYKAGDVDGNGVINIDDVTVYQLTLIHKLPESEAFLKNAETYSDQKISIRDVTVIQLYLVGRFRKLPITTDGYYSQILRP